ncbi:MAG TPA: (deoxy)nucleoside triphosphate pyrophosphohydrolase [Candidatus Deferrimicrobiaceae bacterium]|jgi:8-oxo-dGTP diphosphatase
MTLTPLPVTCGIIERAGKVLCTRRSGTMSHPLKWEFPGGKIKEGESPEECLRRELREELGIEAEVGRSLPSVTHAYPNLSVTLYPFLCRMAPDASITLHEHDRAVWLDPEELPSLDWAEADVGVVDAYLQRLRESGR